MPSTTRTLGIVLILLGLISYFGTGRVSVTALIPAFFGAVFIILAAVARSESARKHAMHAAVALALLALIGTLARVVPALRFPARRPTAPASSRRARHAKRRARGWAAAAMVDSAGGAR